MAIRKELLSRIDNTDMMVATFAFDKEERQREALDVQADLVSVGLSLGQDPDAIQQRIFDLFELYSAEWSAFLFCGSPKLLAAIAADTTLAWLDEIELGLSVRARLINRLS